MWNPKNKALKSAVHVPCWDSFKWNPYLWRGMIFGRTCNECYWSGIRQMRWARGVYAANLGREYIFPYRNIGRHGYKSDLKALCWTYCLLGCVFSCGIGQVFSLCGNFMFNFAAWYSCHAREKLRRRYNLPSTFGCPPGVDDFLVHFLCFYCASHQELRELAVRGVDGPGMHILDVLPESFPRARDANERVKARQLLVTKMLANPPQMFKSRQLKKAVEMGIIQDSVMDNAALATARLLGGDSEEEPEAFGWNLQAPSAQSMTRDGAKLAPPDWDVLHGELEEAVGQPLRRSWSVAF
ncbi:hypothetical protein H632_c751p0 [Helicosporidium sp. ATCC 50920]|nr:hypothetical protein H632_c751p0 [Helicosporidium sp. ATCC 50920]|eukprot:KDD75311.1 hypothetical protein H632_c751p0 [Helicosporidium sp. ATCC 50920]